MVVVVVVVVVVDLDGDGDVEVDATFDATGRSERGGDVDAPAGQLGQDAAGDGAAGSGGLLVGRHGRAQGVLTEEAHHMFVGETGIQRVARRSCELMKTPGGDVRAQGGIDLPTVQKYLNLWFTLSLDLFGGEVSSNAADAFAESLSRVASISLSTYGWQRIAPWP